MAVDATIEMMSKVPSSARGWPVLLSLGLTLMLGGCGSGGGGSSGQAGAGGHIGSGGAGGAGGGQGGFAGGGGHAGFAGGGGAAGGGQLGGGGEIGGAAGGGQVGGSSGTTDGGAGAGGMGCPVADGGTTPAVLPDSVSFVPNVTVSTVAGGASATGFVNPVGIALEPGGTSLVVSDFDNNELDRVTLTGTITALTSQSNFSRPYALAFDPARTVLYSQTDADPSGAHDHATTSTIWIINRGSGAASVLAADVGYTRGIAVLSDGRLVLADRGSHLIRLLDPTTGATSVLAGSAACIGGVDGTGAGAEFSDPYGVAVLPGDTIVVADYLLRVLRKVTLAGVVTTFAGDGGPAASIDGPALSARFIRPQAVAADSNGVVYVSDTGASRIRRIGTDGTVSTLAGDGTIGFMDGTGAMAEFAGAEGIAVSANGSTVYVADGDDGADTPLPYNRVRAITIGP
ncbi:MAG TPA: hypothetical protein VH853_11215 [Polyangia bacterium]|nr:hypothetical protein [Polyangia bacterium]